MHVVTKKAMCMLVIFFVKSMFVVYCLDTYCIPGPKSFQGVQTVYNAEK